MELEELKEILSGMGIEVFEREGVEMINLDDLIKAVIPSEGGQSLEMTEMNEIEKGIELSQDEKLEMAEEIVEDTPGLDLDFSKNENLDMP